MTEPSTVDGLAAVLWDMDGTLVDSEKLWDVALYEGAEWLGGSLTEEQRLTLIGSNLDATARYLLEVNHIPSVTCFPELWQEYVDVVSAWVGKQGEPVAVASQLRD